MKIKFFSRFLKLTLHQILVKPISISLSSRIELYKARELQIRYLINKGYLN